MKENKNHSRKEVALKIRLDEVTKELYNIQIKFSELHYDFKKLEHENRILKKYIRHIQEYLGKDIYELIDKNDRGEDVEDS